MKKTILFILMGCYVVHGIAQEKADTTNVAENDTATAAASVIHKLKTNDELLPKVAVDLNFKYGGAAQKANLADIQQAYLHSVNVSTATPTFSKGRAVSGDMELTYFFGDKHMIGIGAGLMYQQLSGDLSISKFHVEYNAVDQFGDNYRHVITANNTITESIKTTNVSIPILAKFRHQFKKEWGVFAEAGGLLNISATSTYNTNGTASFDYEAIYQYGANGKGVYDNSDINSLATSDWLITKQHYLFANTDKASVTTYFNDLAGKGYNVGLNKTPQSSGKTSYSKLGLGMLVQGGVSYQLNYHMTANLGGYYMLQSLQNSGNTNWHLTDTTTRYNSMLKGVKSNTVQSYGLTIGVRYFIGKDRDIDGDGIADVKDGCPMEFGLAQFGGCPDSDNDGIPDKDDRCVAEFGSACTEGCPDRDEDCVPDKIDQCPDAPGNPDNPWAALGCPDRDADGVADDDDRCPDVPGKKKFAGCLDAVTAYSTDLPAPDPKTVLPHHMVLEKSVINFKTGKTDIADSTYPALDDVVKKMVDDDRMIVYISGHTDDVGSYQSNMLLSFYRAEMVQKYLLKHNIAKNRVLISGQGKNEPVIDNDSAENRAKNRRIEMRLLIPVTQ